jgi:hypothetical protein
MFGEAKFGEATLDEEELGKAELAGEIAPGTELAAAADPALLAAFAAETAAALLAALLALPPVDEPLPLDPVPELPDAGTNVCIS